MTKKVKLTSARCGHTFDKNGHASGMFSQAAGDVVEMSSEEAQRHVDKGLAIYHDGRTKATVKGTEDG